MLIENWKEAWKFLSVQLLIIVGIIAGLEQYIPQLEMFLPDKWMAYVLPLIAIARIIKQNNVGGPYE